MNNFDISGYLSAFSELIRAAGTTEEIIDKDFCECIKKVGACLGVFKAELMVIGYSFPENIVILRPTIVILPIQRL